MRKQNISTRLVSGVLAIMMAFSPVLSDISAYASDMDTWAEVETESEVFPVHERDDVAVMQNFSDDSQIDIGSASENAFDHTVSVEFHSTHGRIVVEDGESKFETRLHDENSDWRY